MLFVTDVVTIPIPRIPSGNSGISANEKTNHADFNKTAYQEATNIYWQKIRESAAISAPDPELEDGFSEDYMQNHDLEEERQERINFRKDDLYFLASLNRFVG